jgi:hypothetical protein
LIEAALCSVAQRRKLRNLQYDDDRSQGVANRSMPPMRGGDVRIIRVL